MGTAASSFVNPAELDGVGAQPTAKILARRATQRRQILLMIGGSYIIDAGLLLIYAQAGAIPFTIGPAYAATGLTVVAFGILLRSSASTTASRTITWLRTVDRLHADRAGVQLCRTGSRWNVPVHDVHRVQLQFAAFDAGADHGDLDRDDDRPDRTVSC